MGVLDTAFDAALATQAGLVGEQAMEELQVRPAALLGVGQSGVELVRRYRNTQGRRSRRGFAHAGLESLSVSSGSSAGFSWDGVSSAASSGKSKC